MTRSYRIALLSLVATAASIEPVVAAERAFVQIETVDIDRSELWYRGVFGMDRVNRFVRATSEKRVLRGPDLIVEMDQSIPASPVESTRSIGFRKAGLEIADFDQRLQHWRSRGIIGSADRVILDESLGLATVLLRDPDNNIVQVFGKSKGPFDFVVKISPELGTTERKPQ